MTAIQDSRRRTRPAFNAGWMFVGFALMVGLHATKASGQSNAPFPKSPARRTSAAGQMMQGVRSPTVNRYQVPPFVPPATAPMIPRAAMLQSTDELPHPAATDAANAVASEENSALDALPLDMLGAGGVGSDAASASNNAQDASAANSNTNTNSTGDPAKPPPLPPGVVMPWQVINPDNARQLAAIPSYSQPEMDPDLAVVPFAQEDFLPTPLPIAAYDPVLEMSPYRGKFAVQTQRPWLELGREFYGSGLFPPPPTWFGPTNLGQTQFLVYGDFRTGVGFNRNQARKQNAWGNRLNLDMDLRLTSTERIHAFTGPLDDGARFSGYEVQHGKLRGVDAMDFEFDTLFFEGDVGNIYGGMAGVQHPFDLPFTFGVTPLLFQNGVWMEDAVAGAAFTIPARNSAALQWSNFDATFFAAFDQINSGAFGADNNAADVIGTAWFIDAYEGYIETGWAYLDDTREQGRSYHNATVAFTRRYYHRLSNAIRLIVNFGQDLPQHQRTADGFIVLVENSLVSATPYTFVPYCNFWYSDGRPQSVARAGGSGGILRNTGINFESDGLTGYPTLDANAANTHGAAVGMNMLGYNFRDQWLVELAALGGHGDETLRSAAASQYAIGTRYQKPISNATLIRFDLMYGWLVDREDVVGARFEYRWKF